MSEVYFGQRPCYYIDTFIMSLCFDKVHNQRIYEYSNVNKYRINIHFYDFIEITNKHSKIYCIIYPILK